MIGKIIDNHTIKIMDQNQFDPYAILHSGQVFRYFELAPQHYLIISGKEWAKIEETDQEILITCSDANYFYNYFDLDTNYQKIKASLAFPKLSHAISLGGGIRILKADFIETVISFIISANNNIKRFTKTLNELCRLYGEKLFGDFYAFPTLEQLGKITQDEFKKLGCGYRDKYLVTAVKQLKSLDVKHLELLPSLQLKLKLQKICGVGPKVASCIMLFAFGRYEVVPVDTWIKKAIVQLSPEEQNAILKGRYGGVAQQYIFYYLQHLHYQELR